MFTMYRNIFLMLIFMMAFYSVIYANEKGIFDKELSNTINEYYQSEKNGDWERTYSIRTPLYRKSIPLKLYKNKMIQDSTGWTLIDFKIIEKAIEGDYAAFKIEFIEEVPDGYFPNKFKKAIRLTDISTWERINGIWFCRDACDRTHLSMNGDLVMENDQAPINLLTK